VYSIEEFPYFKRWFNEVSERPAVKRGLAVGSDFSTNAADLSPEQTERRAKLLYNQRARPVLVT
jgi:GSH-dependent disulfide-bond oxidoreductase